MKFWNIKTFHEIDLFFYCSALIEAVSHDKNQSISTLAIRCLVIQYFAAQMIDGVEKFCYPLLAAVVTANIILTSELKLDPAGVKAGFDFFILYVTDELVHTCIIKNILKYPVSFKNVSRDAEIVSVSSLFHLSK